ncbi:MAG: rhomboid family intramembrane serine protease [Tenacibaculum sp.]
MDKRDKLNFSQLVLTLPIVVVLMLWIIYGVEIKFEKNFNDLGIYPRTVKGLRGVLFSPFIHINAKHLLNNSIPLFVLSSLALFFYGKTTYKVFLYGGLATGMTTWLIGRQAYHIGSSGLVYMLFSFVFFSGIIKKHYRLTSVSLIVVFLYGSMIWYLFPVKNSISWEGHLAGFVTGVALAYVYRKEGIVKKKFVFSKTEFDDMFDKQGNYLGDGSEQIELDDSSQNSSSGQKYNYVYKPRDKQS